MRRISTEHLLSPLDVLNHDFTGIEDPNIKLADFRPALSHQIHVHFVRDHAENARHTIGNRHFTLYIFLGILRPEYGHIEHLDHNLNIAEL